MVSPHIGIAQYKTNTTIVLNCSIPIIVVYNYIYIYICVLWCVSMRSMRSMYILRLIVIQTLSISGYGLIICTDYNGNHREQYNTIYQIQDLRIVNDIAYYVTYCYGKDRYDVAQLHVCLTIEHAL